MQQDRCTVDQGIAAADTVVVVELLGHYPSRDLRTVKALLSYP